MLASYASGFLAGLGMAGPGEIRGIRKTEAGCFFSALRLLQRPQDGMSPRLQPLSGGLSCALLGPGPHWALAALIPRLTPEALQW